jgi:hypothetical protein
VVAVAIVVAVAVGLLVVGVDGEVVSQELELSARIRPPIISIYTEQKYMIESTTTTELESIMVYRSQLTPASPTQTQVTSLTLMPASVFPPW